MQRACLWLLQTVFIVSLAVPLGGCGTHANANEEEQVADVRLAVALPLEGASIGERSSSSLRSAQSDRTASAAITDVARILVDITNVTANPNRVIFRNTELVRGNDGIWSATLPFLPRAVMLEFRSTAFNTGGTALFTGVQQQTLTSVNTTVTIGLNPVDNNSTLVIPRISRISVPTELSSGGSGSITVGVEGASGEVIRFSATAGPNGGEIFPQTGQITLAGTSGSLVFQYTAPVLSTEQVFEHTIQIENPRGTRIQSNFSTRVLQVGQTPSTSGTQLRVQFSPIINNLVARRIPNTSSIEWSAEVSDDRPTDQNLLTYSWAFLPAATYTPELSFTNSTTRSSVLLNYDTPVSGTIRLVVTDADNGTTTLNWTLPVNQFLAQSDLIVDVTNVGGLASVVAGGTHSCARLTTGGMRCWGRGNEGQLGYGNTTTYGSTADKLPYTAGTIPSLERALQMDTGTQHTCALFDNGQVACWGRNLEGQLGYNTTAAVGDNESVASYGYVNVGGNSSRIAVGGKHTCAVLDTGNVRCWGQNSRGQLGYGSFTITNPFIGDNEAPYTVGDVILGGALVADVVAGDEHTCVLLRDGNVRCWGRNLEGQLGYGRSDDIGDNEIPLTTNLNFNGATVRQLAAGANHTCALLTNGAVRCWGQNNYGQLGIPELYTTAVSFNNWGDIASETPYSLQTTYGDVNLGAGRVALQISTGANHTCATLDTGAVVCWGDNRNGELGLGDAVLRDAPPTVPNTTPPVLATVQLGASVVRLASGANHNCALLTTGGVRCWGRGADGQLGYGNTQNIGDTEQADAAGPVSLLAP
ncbi:RTX toxin [Hyalangium sp.]|uniref:RCC1 domain-containing protein n=1 Tax=Hyalangium sp. TaxID=2028555 RepID=UPI002D6350E3|nr:RTX toxin [Hyalangium sp.]HYI02318.1 RTX toxin [Hyalangium sp.]